MKKKVLILLFALIYSVGCVELDLNPLFQASSGNWNTNEEEIEMSLNHLFEIDFWRVMLDYKMGSYDFRDQWVNGMCTTVASLVFSQGGLNSKNSEIKTRWTTHYEVIAAANILIEKIDELKDQLSSATKFEAEARFVRACHYANLIFHWGDVPFYTNTLLLADAQQMGRTDKNEILKTVYEDFDYAIANLGGINDNGRVTKGAALAMKARYALYMGDYEIARDAAKACIDLGEYELYPDFGELFHNETRNANEMVFGLPFSASLGQQLAIYTTRLYLPRYISSAWHSVYPTWEVFHAFLCTDGLPVDESPLYNPQEPFQNRDPRLSETIVEFGTEFLGIIYQPHPDSTITTNVETGERISNPDCITTYSSINGLVFKKRISDAWKDIVADNDYFIIRYADVLLMYAEARIELNQIDQSVLDAMNKVRARAYKVNYSETSSYPAINTTNQVALRKILRQERMMEFVMEGLRYQDIVRWKIAGKALNGPTYKLLVDRVALEEKIIKKGLWYFPGVPEIDEDGIPDFTPWHNEGLVDIMAVNIWEDHYYLWPIPTSEITINSNLTQNSGY